MRRLILMRHAKAERLSDSGQDHDRPLTPRGVADARLMARELAARGLRPDLAIVSDAARTQQTWAAMAEVFGDVPSRVEPRLYNAAVDRLRDEVEGVGETAETVLLIAHNPGVQLLAYALLVEAAASEAVLARVESFPTGAAAVFAIDAAGRPAYDGVFTPKGFGGGAEG
jgi:phosphohistidine phosphatase